ncbi:MAG: SGNH/GDSL hydrolase family protein [Thermodesulfobacteriota bacterium]|nr:SGNH/GDSL hydrolase family protein [Thermodesulfobacteriota bacterium]
MKRVLSGIGAFALVFLIIEGMARIAYTVLLDLNTNKTPEWYLYSPDLGWERKPGFSGIAYGAKREFDSEGLFSVDTADKFERRKTKIICIGDSNTFGNEVSTENTFVEQVERLLPEVSAINLGVPGYTSYQGYKLLLEHGLDLEPDILVVSFNLNDRRYVLHSDETDSDAKFRRLYEQKRMEKWNRPFHNVYLYRSVRFLMQALGIIQGLDETKDVRLDALYPRVGPRAYRENLVGIAELAKGRGIRTIFLLLKDNPIKTEHLRKGIDYFQKSDYDLTISNLRIAVRNHHTLSTLARIYLAKALDKHGSVDEASKAWILTNPFVSIHGGHTIRLDEEYNDIMKEVAEEYDLEVVDAGRVLDEDPSDYYDFCHFDANGHRKVAHLLSSRIVDMLSRSATSTGGTSLRTTEEPKSAGWAKNLPLK